MRLLVCTQAVDANDPILGFFHAWLLVFAKHCEHIIVVCLRKGEVQVPQNVEVIALGDRGKLLRAFELSSIAFGRRREYDAVFVHMNPEYVIATGWLWKLLRKRVGLWYVHKSRAYLRAALPFVDRVFTVSKHTFPIASRKVEITGHGIDTDVFAPRASSHEGFRIATVGRISAKKNTRLLAEAVLAFARKHANVSFDIYGTPSTNEEKEYAHDLGNWLQIEDMGRTVHIKGAVRHSDVPAALHGTSVFLNMGETGGVDKAVLEAMAMGIPTISSGEANAALLTSVDSHLAIPAEQHSMTDALVYVHALTEAERRSLGARLRDVVVRDHSLQSLIPRIVRALT